MPTLREATQNLFKTHRSSLKLRATLKVFIL